MLATFAEWEREIIRERIAERRDTIKARGERSAGRVPLGYRTDRLTKQLVIDEGLRPRCAGPSARARRARRRTTS